MTSNKINSDSARSTIPLVLNAIGAVGEAMPSTFRIPAPTGAITGAVQVGILRKEQIQRTVLHGLPTGVKEGLATRSAHGFALGTLSGALMYDVKHHRENMDELRAAFRNASDRGEIVISNPLSFYVPKTPRDAVSTILGELAKNPSSLDQAEKLYNKIQERRSHGLDNKS